MAWTENTYFEHAKRLPLETQRALRDLYELRAERGVKVTFGAGGDGSMKIALKRAGGASVMMAWNHDGSLMVTFQFHQDNRSVVEPLGTFASAKLGVGLESDWKNTKPYVPAAQWTPHVTDIVEFVRHLAAG